MKECTTCQTQSRKAETQGSHQNAIGNSGRYDSARAVAAFSQLSDHKQHGARRSVSAMQGKVQRSRLVGGGFGDLGEAGRGAGAGSSTSTVSGSGAVAKAENRGELAEAETVTVESSVSRHALLSVSEMEAVKTPGCAAGSGSVYRADRDQG
jgi:hypothetical protein